MKVQGQVRSHGAIRPWARYPWMKRDPTVSRAYLQGPGDDRVHWRWTVDHPDDLASLRRVAEDHGDSLSDWHSVSEHLRQNHKLLDINRGLRDR